MKIHIGKKLSWIICGISWLTAVASIFFLPDKIPAHFSDGVPGNYLDESSIFLWPMIQMIIMLLGENRKMLPRQLNELLSEDQHNWAIFGLILFVFLLELLIVING